MSERKYVIVETEFGIECAMLFPKLIQHREGAFYFMRREQIVAGGFFGIDKNFQVHTWGNSESLKVSSRPEDAALVATLLGLTAAPVTV